MPIMKYMLTVTEAASLMGYSAGKVYQLIHADTLKAYKDDGGRIWHIPFASIIDYTSSCLHRKPSEK